MCVERYQSRWYCKEITVGSTMLNSLCTKYQATGKLKAKAGAYELPPKATGRSVSFHGTILCRTAHIELTIRGQTTPSTYLQLIAYCTFHVMQASQLSRYDRKTHDIGVSLTVHGKVVIFCDSSGYLDCTDQMFRILVLLPYIMHVPHSELQCKAHQLILEILYC